MARRLAKQQFARCAFAVLGALAAFGLASTPSIACIDCNFVTCSPAFTQYSRCVIKPPNLCMFSGVCPGSVASHPVIVEISLWEATSANTQGFPSVVSETLLTSVRGQIAAIGGLPVSSVVLRGNLFVASYTDLDGSRLEAFTGIAGAGFAMKVQFLGDSLTDVTVCGFPTGGPFSVRGTAAVPSDHTFLVPLPSSPQVVMALTVRRPSAVEFESTLVPRQNTFNEAIQDLITAPEFTLGLGFAPANCTK